MSELVSQKMHGAGNDFVVIDSRGRGAVVTAALARDYPLLQAGIFLTAVFVVSLNLVVDMLCAMLDPRIRAAGARG